MADCEYQIGGKGKFYSESEFKKLLSEGYLDKVMMEESLTIKGIKPNEAIASSFQLPSAIQPTVPVTEVKIESINSVLNPKHKGFGERMEGSKDKVKQTFEEDNNVDYVFRNSSKEEVDNLLSGEGKTGDFWRSEPNEYSNYGDYIIVKKTPDLKEYGREYSKGNKIENDGFNYVGEKVDTLGRTDGISSVNAEKIVGETTSMTREYWGLQIILIISLIIIVLLAKKKLGSS